MRDELPIISVLPEVKAALSAGNLVILQAPPGAGKSTVLPLHLLDSPWLKDGKILMLEPRRLAAKMVANRLAQQINEETGETIGYRIRFEKKISSATKLEILTEGILTRMLAEDQALEQTGMVIFDEFHERSIHADLALVLCYEIQQALRPDLKILIMSATLDTEFLMKAFPGAPLIKSEGRQYPVTIHYSKEEERTPLSRQMGSLIRLAIEKEEGDILAFFPGTGEIRRTKELLDEELRGVNVVPLYGDLSWKEQQEAILPNAGGIRKVVLATSIAETSLTIEGIRVVVDCGYSRVPRFDPRSGLTRLETIKVSKDTAEQRAGRAGRLGPGVAYRMWEEGKQQYLLPHRKPEILEADLAPLLLELSNWGQEPIQSFHWVTAPPDANVSQARQLLEELGAVRNGLITTEGKEMAKYPTHPRISKMFLESRIDGNLSLACDVAALLEERNPMRKEDGVNMGLGLDLLQRWRRKEKTNAERFLLERLEKVSAEWKKRTGAARNDKTYSDTDAGHLVAFAYPERIAKKISGTRYRLANGRTAKLEDHDPLSHEEWLAIAHMDAGTGEGKIFLAAPIDPEDIQHLSIEKDVMLYDEQKDELLLRREKRIDGIVLESKPLKEIPREEFEKLLCEVVRMKGLSLFESNEDTDQLRTRLGSLRKWAPEQWPDLSDQSLLADCEKNILPFLTDVKRMKDLKKIPLKNILLNTLTWEQQLEIDKLAPRAIKVPSGSEIKINYSKEGSQPVLAVRLQEVFGLTETPAIMNGKIRLIMHLLSPGYKPVQVTQDLASFWKTTYHEVRKELRIRYPRHSWPEDPMKAEAVRGPRKRR